MSKQCCAHGLSAIRRAVQDSSEFRPAPPVNSKRSMAVA